MGNKPFIFGERKRKNPLDRLKKKSIIDLTTNCWIWQGSNTGHSGYGYISYLGRMVSVHRLSAHLNLNFDLKSKLFICHKRECPNKMCWNPEHLYIGTRSENSKDSEFIKRNKLNA